MNGRRRYLLAMWRMQRALVKAGKSRAKMEKAGLDFLHGARHGEQLVVSRILSPNLLSKLRQPAATRNPENDTRRICSTASSIKPTLTNIQEKVQLLQRNSALHRIDALIGRKFGEIDSKARGM
jgi:hypothetical protein